MLNSRRFNGKLVGPNCVKVNLLYAICLLLMKYVDVM